jgi:heme iron utilization protein
MANHISAVRELVKREPHGMFCTLSQKLGGFPFGSITPFALSGAGEPLILISEIAEHTRNVRADARASLLITDARALADPQAGARATLVGYTIPVSPPFLEDARRRYARAFPNSASYFQAHDFTLFKLKVGQVRYIGGFGDIHWLAGNEVLDRAAEASLDALAPHVDGICAHMNDDHGEAMIAYARAFASLDADAVTMLSVDQTGFDLIAVSGGAHKPLRLNFDEPVTTTEGVRKAMVELVRRARQRLAG